MTEDLRGKVTQVWEEELAQVENSCEDDTELECLKEQVDEEVYVARRLLAWLRRRDAGLDYISTIACNTHCLQPLLPPV